MGRYNLNLRPVYDRDEPTTGEGIARGIQTGLDYFAARDEAARAEQNDVLSRGGVRLPDAPTPSIGERVRGIGRRIGEVVHGTPGRGTLQPTGPFAGSPGSRGSGEALPDIEPDNDPDDIVSRAINPSAYPPVVRPQAPVGALPPVARGSLAGPSIQPNPGLPPLMSPVSEGDAMGMPGAPGAPTVPAYPGERSFDYQGLGNRRYSMPQAGERERVNRMVDYGQQAAIKEGVDDRNDARTSARSLEHDQRMVDYYDRRDIRRGDQQAAHDARKAAIDARLAALRRTGAGNSPEAMELRRERLALDERKFAAQGERGAASTDVSVANQQQRGVKADPYGMLTDEEKAANQRRQSQADQTAQSAREHAGNARAIAQGARANRPPARPDLSSARAEESRLMRSGLSQQAARQQMRAAGWPIK